MEVRYFDNSATTRIKEENPNRNVSIFKQRIWESIITI